MWRLEAVRKLALTRKIYHWYLLNLGSTNKWSTHSFLLPDGERISGSYPLENLVSRFRMIPFVEKEGLGLKAMDIGASDGFFSFEMEKLGFDVTAVDMRSSPVFRYVKKKTGSSVSYKVVNIERQPIRWDRFDIILMLSVLEQLANPLDILSTMLEKMTGCLVLETYLSDIDGCKAIEVHDKIFYYKWFNLPLIRHFAQKYGCMLYQSASPCWDKRYFFLMSRRMPSCFNLSDYIRLV